MDRQFSSGRGGCAGERRPGRGVFGFWDRRFGGLGVVWAALFCQVWGAWGQVKLTERTNYYVVTGASLREIHQSMQASRPWRVPSNKVGKTDWRITWQSQVAPSDDGCRISLLRVQATITVTVPVLRMMTNTPPEVIQTWQQFLAALMRHEQGHVQIARRAAAQVHGQAGRLGSAGDCASLRRRIDEVARHVLDACHQEQAAYDRTTRHGETQGVHLPRFGPGERPRRWRGERRP